MTNWTREYSGIDISYEDRIVRVRVDGSLTGYLHENRRQACVRLSEYIHGRYRELFQKELEITLHSLSVEILIHVLAYRVSKFLHWKKMMVHTQVIDCGERAVDNNRFVFDFLEKCHGLVYRLGGIFL